MVQNLNGVIAVCNTHFNRENEIDHVSLRKYVQNALSGGVVGFLVPAKAAEVDKLSSLEREQMVATVIDEIKGKVPVIGGASADTQEDRLFYTRSLIALGCEGVLVSIPFEDQISYKKNIFEIAELQPGFLMLQDWDFHGYGIPIDIIVELFEKIETHHPTAPQVVMFSDNATYFYSAQVREWLESHPRLWLLPLPPYAPNLNLIERFWKFAKEELVKNTYYEKYMTFRAQVFRFLNHVDRYVEELKTLMVEKFQIIQPKVASCLQEAVML